MSTALARVLTPALVATAGVYLNASDADKLGRYVEEIESLTASVKAGPIASAIDEAQLTELMVRSARAAKDLEALRKARVKPLRDEEAAINAIVRSVTAPLAEFDAAAARQLRAWRDAEAARIRRAEEESRRRQEEAARAEQEAILAAQQATTDAERQAAEVKAQTASMEQAAAVVAAPAPLHRGTRTESGTVGTRKVWTFEVVDPTLVPREYLTVDQVAIREAVAAGVRVIAGVSITESEQFTRRVS